MSGYDQNSIAVPLPTVTGTAAALGGPYKIKPSEAFSGALMTVSGLTGETISVQTSPDGYWGAPANPTFYRTDWQGTQQLYSTARTNKAWRSQPTIAQLAVKSATVTDTTAPAPFPGGAAIKFPAALQNDYAYVTCDNTILNPIVSLFIVMDDAGAPVPGTTSTNGDFLLVVNAGANTATSNITTTSLGGGLYRVSAKWVGTTTSTSFGLFRYATQSGRGFTVMGYQIETDNGTSLPTSLINCTGAATTVTDYTISNGVITLAVPPLSGATLSYDNSVLPSPYFIFATGDGTRTAFAYDGVWGTLSTNSGKGNGIWQIDLRGAQAFKLVKSAGVETATVNMTLKRDALQYKNTAGTWTVT